MENQCYVKWKYNCDDKGELTEAGPACIESVIRKEYKDNVHVDLVDRLGKNPELINDDIANQVRVRVEGALSDLILQALCLLNLFLLPNMLQRKMRIQTLHLMKSLVRC